MNIDIEKLKNIISETQPKLDFDRRVNNKFDLGTYGYSSSDYGNVRIRFYERDNILRVTHLFLVNISCGTGTKIIKYFIEQCKINNYEKLIIVNAKESDEIMKKLCANFQCKKTSNDYVDYELCLK